MTASARLAATITAAVITADTVSGEGAAWPVLRGRQWSEYRSPSVCTPGTAARLSTSAACSWRSASHGFSRPLPSPDDELLYSIGRVAGWGVDAFMVWLILAFPSGRLQTRVDRLLVWMTVGLVAVLYLPTALLADEFPVPSPYTSCDGGCPENALSVVATEPAFLDGAILPLREVLTVLIFLAVTARLVQRVLRATPLTRLALSPVLAVAGARLIIVAMGIGVRWVSPDSALLDGLIWAITLTIPALSAAFLLGLLQRRLYAASALQRLGANARGKLTLGELQDVVSEAVGDPRLQLVYPVNGWRERWADARGWAVKLPGPDSGLCFTEVREGGRSVAGIIHDDALRDEIDFVHAVGSHALSALENRRLASQVASSLEEVRESRTRILASGDRERRRIERDLHDGAQQRLVALGIQLELTEELIKEDRQRGLDKLHSLGGEVSKTLEEIQALARGVYPSLLADRGLAEALRAAALRLPLGATVDPDGLGRYPADVENAVYFCCLEAMQNASKHARNAGGVIIVLGENDGLVFEVRDDGAGFDRAAVTAGAGLTNMRDRLAALGGELDIRSAPGAGTVVAGRIPLDTG